MDVFNAHDLAHGSGPWRNMQEVTRIAVKGLLDMVLNLQQQLQEQQMQELERGKEMTALRHQLAEYHQAPELQTLQLQQQHQEQLQEAHAREAAMASSMADMLAQAKGHAEASSSSARDVHREVTSIHADLASFKELPQKGVRADLGELRGALGSACSKEYVDGGLETKAGQNEVQDLRERVGKLGGSLGLQEIRLWQGLTKTSGGLERGLRELEIRVGDFELVKEKMQELTRAINAKADALKVKHALEEQEVAMKQRFEAVEAVNQDIIKRMEHALEEQEVAVKQRCEAVVEAVNQDIIKRCGEVAGDVLAVKHLADGKLGGTAGEIQVLEERLRVCEGGLRGLREAADELEERMASGEMSSQGMKQHLGDALDQLHALQDRAAQGGRGLNEGELRQELHALTREVKLLHDGAGAGVGAGAGEEKSRIHHMSSEQQREPLHLTAAVGECREAVEALTYSVGDIERYLQGGLDLHEERISATEAHCSELSEQYKQLARQMTGSEVPRHERETALAAQASSGEEKWRASRESGKRGWDEREQQTSGSRRWSRVNEGGGESWRVREGPGHSGGSGEGRDEGELGKLGAVTSQAAQEHSRMFNRHSSKGLASANSSALPSPHSPTTVTEQMSLATPPHLKGRGRTEELRLELRPLTPQAAISPVKIDRIAQLRQAKEALRQEIMST